MEQQDPLDKIKTLTIGIVLVLCVFGAVALMSSETFMVVQASLAAHR